MTPPRLFRSAGIISLGTMTSRILGLLREILMAALFGTSTVASAFFIAFTIPNLFRRLFGEGALSAAFIPAYVRTRDQHGPEAGWALLRNLLSLLILLLGAISLLGIATATLALHSLPLPDRIADILNPLRIMLPYMLWICLAALIMGVLHSHRIYLVSAFAPCILNLVWILAMLATLRAHSMSDSEKILCISWAILLAGVLQFAVQIPFLRRLGYQSPPHIRPLGPGVRRVMALTAPAALGAAVTQINVLIDRSLAFWAGSYGPAALTFAERLIYLPLGIFATALGSILLPELSALAHQHDRDALAHTLERGMRGLLFLMVPAAVGLGVLAAPIVSLLYARGQFDADSVLYTSRALIAYAPGLVVFSLAKVLIPAFYAHHDTRTPVKIAACAVIANITLNILFIILLPHGWKHAGLALGTVLSELGQVTALALLLRKRHARPRWSRILAAGAKHLLASFPMTAAALGILHLLQNRPPLLAVPSAILAAALTYFLAARLLRCREFHDLRRH